jgi:agmatine deiminase
MARLKSRRPNTHSAQSAQLLPAAHGFRMPAEWEPHEATWLAWPHERTDWPGKFEPIPWVYADIVRHLSQVEKVRIVVDNAKARTQAQAILKKSSANLAGVEFFIAPTNRGWIRDFGPIFIVNGRGRSATTDWRFNGWAKYGNSKKDDAVTGTLLKRLKLESWQPVQQGHRIVLEGGSIDVNGRGAVLTTEECLLSDIQCRNPKLSREDLEAVFRDYLGIRKVLWLSRGIAGDDTHGHVDDLTRFVNPSTVVTVIEQNPRDVNYQPLQENLERLRGMTDQDDQPLKIETLPMPAPVYFDGQRLPASYANFYIANKIVLVPTFSDPNDTAALNTLAQLFPDRQMIGIPCRDLVLGLGTLHCMTQQQPA